jgi:hypothetical protein
MNDLQIKDRVKKAVKNALKGNLKGEDVKSIIRFQNKELEMEKGESLDDFELGLLGAYSVAFN